MSCLFHHKCLLLRFFLPSCNYLKANTLKYMHRMYKCILLSCVFTVWAHTDWVVSQHLVFKLKAPLALCCSDTCSESTKKDGLSLLPSPCHLPGRSWCVLAALHDHISPSSKQQGGLSTTTATALWCISSAQTPGWNALVGLQITYSNTVDSS